MLAQLQNLRFELLFRSAFPTSPIHGAGGYRASDKGFLPMSEIEYIRLLDWTVRVIVPGKLGATPADAPDVLERLGLDVPQWTGLVRDFGRLFSLAAGLPETLTQQRTRLTQRPWHTRRGFRELFESKAAQTSARRIFCS